MDYNAFWYNKSILVFLYAIRFFEKNILISHYFTLYSFGLGIIKLFWLLYY